ncbi:MAG: putative polysaccharide biosynthesis protein [Bacillota bacterium]
MPRESFVKGAFVLTAAAFLTKLLGAVYRIPLYPILGDQGFGLFQMAYPIYGMALVLSTSGINVAISKLVAERLASGDRKGAAEAFKSSLVLLAASGLVFGGLLFAASGWIAARVTHDSRATLSIAAISPAVLLVSVMSAYRGLFQGLQQMVPTAVSQVVEQLVRVITMLLLAVLLMPRGVEFAAAGATFGAVTGAVAGLIYLLAVFRQSHVTKFVGSSAAGVSVPTMGTVLRIAIPVSLASGVLGLTQIVDMALVPWRLQAAGLSVPVATAQYGEMSGAALPLVNLPTILTAALQVSLVPAIAADSAVGDAQRVTARMRTALRLTFQVMLPAATGLWVLAEQIAILLFRDPDVAVPLASLASSAVFMGLQQTTSGILQGLGLLQLPVRHLLWGTSAKFVITLWLTSAVGIRGACYGTVVGFAVAALLNLTALARRFGRLLSLRDMLVAPSVACLVMAAALRPMYAAARALTHSGNVSTLLAIVGGMLVYSAGVGLLGGLKREDVQVIPVVGQRLALVLQRLGLLR